MPLSIPNCPICLDEGTQDFSVTLCGHVFHTPCIRRWAGRDAAGGRCPVCRQIMRRRGTSGFTKIFVEVSVPAESEQQRSHGSISPDVDFWMALSISLLDGADERNDEIEDLRARLASLKSVNNTLRMKIAQMDRTALTERSNNRRTTGGATSAQGRVRRWEFQDKDLEAAAVEISGHRRRLPLKLRISRKATLYGQLEKKTIPGPSHWTIERLEQSEREEVDSVLTMRPVYFLLSGHSVQLPKTAILGQLYERFYDKDDLHLRLTVSDEKGTFTLCDRH